MSELLEQIKNKYDYSDEIMNYISTILNGFLIYYSSYQQIVVDTFLNTRIVFYELKNSNEKEKLIKKYSDKTDEEIESQTLYEGGELLHKLNEDDTLEYTIIIRNDHDENVISTLIHELCHAMVSPLTVQVDEKNMRYIKSGVSKHFLTSYEYRLNSEIEEGFTEYDTEKICEIIGCNYTRAYQKHYDYVSASMDNKYIANILLKTRLEDINYIDKIKDEDIKSKLDSYIRNYGSICNNRNRDEQKELFDINKKIITELRK